MLVTARRRDAILRRMQGALAGAFLVTFAPAAMSQILDAGRYTAWQEVWRSGTCGIDVKQQPGVFLGDKVVFYYIRNRCPFMVRGTIQSAGPKAQTETFFRLQYDKANRQGGEIGGGETWVY